MNRSAHKLASVSTRTLELSLKGLKSTEMLIGEKLSMLKRTSRGYKTYLPIKTLFSFRSTDFTKIAPKPRVNPSQTFFPKIIRTQQTPRALRRTLSCGAKTPCFCLINMKNPVSMISSKLVTKIPRTASVHLDTSVDGCFIYCANRYPRFKGTSPQTRSEKSNSDTVRSN